MRAFLIWLIATLPALAKDDVAGEFDYYVLALSWSPNWCAIEGDATPSMITAGSCMASGRNTTKAGPASVQA